MIFLKKYIINICQIGYEHPHHIGTQVLIRYLRSFSFCQKPLGARFFGAFTNEICYIVSKVNTQKLRVGDFNPSHFAPNQTTMTLYPKDKCHRNKD
jgi:hypothetical protein